MKTSVKFSPVALPARMSLIPSAFDGMEVAVFEFPYETAFAAFMGSLKSILRKDRLEQWRYPPYRLLNSALIACAPTLVHGFEKCGNTFSPGRRALAVGKPKHDESGLVIGSTLEYPSEQQIAVLIRLWAYQWGQTNWLKKLIETEAQSAWQNLQAALAEPPQKHWRKISPETLVADLYAENGLAFSAIPSLLATLLHGEVSVIGEQGRQVRWRKAQDKPNRLCVVSDPQNISFLRESQFGPKEASGFFSYKLVFQLQTQAGRAEPWVHVFLRCQRYAHLKLTRNTRGNDVTIMAGMNQSRMAGWVSDTTLVRLKASKHVYKGRHITPEWIDSLSNLLTEFGARKLADPAEIYTAPDTFWDKAKADEYYVVHTEGYHYGRSKHPVMTGFGLAERSEVIEKTCCGVLAGVLKPDIHFLPDAALFSQATLPYALWNIDDLSRRPALPSAKTARWRGQTEEARRAFQEATDRDRRAALQPLPAEAVRKALHGLPLVIALLYRTGGTRDALIDQIRQAFLLNEGDLLPSNVIVIDKPILDGNLCLPLDSGKMSPAERDKHQSQWEDGFEKSWDAQMRRARTEKLSGWRSLLQETFSDFAPGAVCRAALIELPEPPEQKKNAEVTFHESQDIKGVVREACVREGVLSQMLRRAEYQHDRKTGLIVLPAADKGRIKNVVQEIVTRQIGALYGPPSEIYPITGVPEPLASELDIIAFCHRETQSGVKYALAVRLRASGEMDVLLPEEDPRWRPYSEAGPAVGKIFAEGRKDVFNRKIEKECPIRLSPAHLCAFVERTLVEHLERPTVAVIEAENWRSAWKQLQNPKLAARLDGLLFGNGLDSYHRDDPQLNLLIAVVRLRTGDEAPQYVTNRETWLSDGSSAPSRDFFRLSGFVDHTTRDVFHYFSVGRLPDTIKRPQDVKGQEDPYKIETGGGIAFKHQQMVEILPFFVRPDFQSEEGLKTICRVPHYLRASPAWGMGNIALPYPMHLGEKIIEDHLCILGLDA